LNKDRAKWDGSKWLPLLAPEGDATSQTGVAELPTRNEIETAYQWRLEDMYPDQEQWDRDAAEVSELSDQLSEFRGKLTDGSESLLAALQIDDQLGEKLSRLYSFARMRRDEDNTNTTYQALTDRATTLWVQAESAKAFLVPEVLSIPEETLKSFLAESQDLSLYAFVFDELLRQKQHILSESEERLLAEAGEVPTAAG